MVKIIFVQLCQYDKKLEATLELFMKQAQEFLNKQRREEFIERISSTYADYTKMRTSLNNFSSSTQATLEYITKLTKSPAIADNQFNVRESLTIQIVGARKAGKSTFINALLGEEIVAMEESVTCTAARTVIKYGTEKYVEIVSKGASNVTYAKRVDITSGKINPSVFSQPNKLSTLPVDELIVYWPNQVLSAGITLVDNPGLNDLSIDEEKLIFKRTIEKSDVIVYMFDATDNVEQSVRAFVLLIE